MSTALLDLINDVLEDLQSRTWHETTRRDLGLTDETDGEALLALSLCKPGQKPLPLAFVVEQEQVENTLVAMVEYLREALHPVLGSSRTMAMIDFLPPLDNQGKSRGASRRWMVDGTNHHVILPELANYLRTVARGL